MDYSKQDIFCVKVHRCNCLKTNMTFYSVSKSHKQNFPKHIRFNFVVFSGSMLIPKTEIGKEDVKKITMYWCKKCNYANPTENVDTFVYYELFIE